MSFRIKLTERRGSEDMFVMDNIAPKLFKTRFEAKQWLESFVTEGHWRGYEVFVTSMTNTVIYSKVVAGKWQLKIYEIVEA